MVGPVVHRGALDLLPQGHPREGRRRRGDRLPGLGLVPRDAPGDQGQGPGHPAVRHAGQEGVRPRPPRDAVRVGRRRRRAVRGQHASRRSTRPRRSRASSFFADLVKDGLADPSQLERDGTQVENQFKGGKIAVWMGGPWVLGSIEREDDTNWVPAARKNVGVAPMPAGPNGDAFTFVGGSNLMMFESSREQERGLGGHEVPLAGPGADRLRVAAGHVPGADGAAAELRRVQRRELRVGVPGDPAGPDVRADPAVGRGSRTPTRAASGPSSTTPPARATPATRPIQKQLDEAAKEADGLLAQTTG